MKRLIAPIILCVVGLSILLSLCVWQLERAEWKKGLIAELETQLAAPPIPLEELDDFTDGMAVHVTGTIGEGYTDKLTGDSMGAGYVRIVPVQAGDRILAIELGFFNEGAEPSASLAGTQIDVIARIYLPEGGGNYDAGRNLWVGYDLAGMTEMLNAEEALFVPETEVVPGFAARPYRSTLPNNHIQYAITWFLFAIVWLAMAGYWGYARYRNTKS